MNIFKISFIFFGFLFFGVNCNDFSSFLTANASLAVVVDDRYMEKKNVNIIAIIQKAIEDLSRENLKSGGLNVRYFTWSTVRLKKDFIAAITVTDCLNTWKFYEAAEVHSILLLAVTEAECPRLPSDKAVMIPLVDRGFEIPQILLDIRTQNVLEWDSSVLIFDSSIDERLTQVLASLVRENTRNKLKPLSIFVNQLSDNSGNNSRTSVIEQTLIKFKHYKHNRFIVLLSSIEDVLEVAKNLNMFNVYNQWLFFLPNIKYNDQLSSLAYNINEGANIAFAVNTTKANCQESILCSVMDITNGFISALAKVIVEEGALYGHISDEEWEAIRLTKEERQIEILNYIQKYLTEKSKCTGCPNWNFKSMLSWGETRYKNREKLRNDQINFIDSSNWSPLFGFKSSDVLFPHFKHKFRNMSLNIVTYNNPPWQIVTWDEKNNVIQQSGIIIEILKEISLKLNFSYNLLDYSKMIQKQENIEIDKNLKLTGTLTNLMYPRFMETISAIECFLIAIGTTVLNPEDVAFNYTIPISVQMYSFLTKKPNEVSRMYLFAAPFTTETWICLISVVIITAPILCLINKYGPIDELRTVGLCKLKNCYWYIYGALLQQGGLYLPKADSGRVVVGVWWTIVIVLVTTYCGNLVAFLTFPKFQEGVTYLSETFSHKDITIFGLRNGTFFEKYAKNSTRNDFKKYMEKVTIYENVNGEDINAVQQGKRINIDWKINLQLVIQNNFDLSKSCSLILGKESFVDEQISLIVPKESPYLHLINDEITLLHQMGFIDKWHKKYLPSNDKCNFKILSKQIANHKVNMEDMQGCFLILLLGFVFAIFIITGEIWIHRFQQSKVSSKYIK